MACCPSCGSELSPGGGCQKCGPIASAPPSPEPAGPARTSRLAIFSLILSLLGILSFGLTGAIGVVLGVAALIGIKKSGGKVGGKGLAKAGIVLGVLLPFLFFAVVIPQFFRMIKKSKMSEAQTNLGAIHTGQKIFRDETGSYGKTFNDVAWRPEGGNNYAYYLCGDTVSAKDLKAGRPEFLPPLPPGLDTTCGPDRFVAVAIGNLDSDPHLDVWTIDQDKNLNHFDDDITNTQP